LIAASLKSGNGFQFNYFEILNLKYHEYR